MDMMVHIDPYAPFCSHLMTTTRNKKVGQRPTIKSDSNDEPCIPTIGQYCKPFKRTTPALPASVKNKP